MRTQVHPVSLLLTKMLVLRYGFLEFLKEGIHEIEQATILVFIDTDLQESQESILTYLSDDVVYPVRFRQLRFLAPKKKT